MEKVFKETAKKAPVVTIVFVTLIYLVSIILDKEMPIWLLAVIASLVFLISFVAIYMNYKNDKIGINVSDTDISNVNTGGGHFTVGDKSTGEKSLVIEHTKIKNVSTGGGEFVVGKKSE